MTKQQNKRAQKKLVSTFVMAVSLLVLVVGFQNCSGEHSGLNSASGPSQTQLLAEYEFQASLVLEENCASCHSPNSPEVTNGDVTNITDIMDFAFLYQNGYVVAGEPQNSPLYLAVLDGLMPHDGEPLGSIELDILRDWIVALGDPFGTGGIIAAPGEEPADGVVTFTFVYNTIIQPNCVGCHGGANPRNGIALDSYAGVMTQVNFNADDDSINRSSPLYQEIRNGNMPPAGSLPRAQADFILEWIRAGALNN